MWRKSRVFGLVVQYLGRASVKIDSSFEGGTATFSNFSIVGLPSKRCSVDRWTGPNLVQPSQVAVWAVQHQSRDVD